MFSQPRDMLLDTRALNKIKAGLVGLQTNHANAATCCHANISIDAKCCGFQQQDPGVMKIFRMRPVSTYDEAVKHGLEATIPGLVEVRAISQRTSPPSVFSLLFWGFSLEGEKMLQLKVSSVFF